jgi:two-component system alkaline phosphatase synthesis response regulator PhoP
MARGILIVEDEVELRELLAYNLKKEGFTVFSTENGHKALHVLAKNYHEIDLVLLDLMMPEMDGIEVCTEIRKQTIYNDLLICFLTARNEDYIQVAGLDAGADDYISKPLKPRVLISRVNALLRRKRKESTAGIQINRDRYEVTLEDKIFHLPKKEFELLALLASKPGSVFKREVILSTVWGSEIIVGDRTIDVHIRKLREKIGSKYITTVKGVGYKFDME